VDYVRLPRRPPAGGLLAMTSGNYMKRIITKSATETMIWAQKVASGFKGGEVISLEGDLGAGKTVIVKGIAQGLGVIEVVNSPTFVLMKVYGCNNKSIKHLVHVDAYRLGKASELLDIGLGDYLGNKETVVLIEWGDKVKKILPAKTIRFILKHLSPDSRQIDVVDSM